MRHGIQTNADRGNVTGVVVFLERQANDVRSFADMVSNRARSEIHAVGLINSVDGLNQHHRQ